MTLNAAGQQMSVTRYYSIAGQTIAMRDAGGTVYILTDHLGSVVAVLDGSGSVVGEQRYRAAPRSEAEGPPLRPAAPDAGNRPNGSWLYWAAKPGGRGVAGLSRSIP